VTVAIDINPAVASAKAFLTDARAKNGQLVKRKTWRPASELAVDLGTANTLVFVKGEGVVLNEPSVAAIDQATGNILGIGLEAKRMLGRTPEGVLAVRPMKDGVIADFHVAEKMLRHFLRMVIDRTILRVKPTVVVCVPSGITEVERRAVRDSAQSAGVKRLFIVAEPMAAATPPLAPCIAAGVDAGACSARMLTTEGLTAAAAPRKASESSPATRTASGLGRAVVSARVTPPQSPTTAASAEAERMARAEEEVIRNMSDTPFLFVKVSGGVTPVSCAQF
jgi:hypothetical protein